MGGQAEHLFLLLPLAKRQTLECETPVPCSKYAVSIQTGSWFPMKTAFHLSGDATWSPPVLNLKTRTSKTRIKK